MCLSSFSELLVSSFFIPLKRKKKQQQLITFFFASHFYSVLCIKFFDSQLLLNRLIVNTHYTQLVNKRIFIEFLFFSVRSLISNTDPILIYSYFIGNHTARKRDKNKTLPKIYNLTYVEVIYIFDSSYYKFFFLLLFFHLVK